MHKPRLLFALLCLKIKKVPDFPGTFFIYEFI